MERSRRAFALKILLALALALLALGWLARDWPRQLLAGMLSSRLEAEVRIGRLEIAARDSFLLHDLVVSAPAASPTVVWATIRTLAVEGEVRELIAGHVRAIRADGLRVAVRPGRELLATRDEASTLRVGSLEADGAGLVFCPERGDCPFSSPAALEFGLRASRPADAWLGRVEASGERLDAAALGPYLPLAPGLAGSVAEPRAVIELDGTLRAQLQTGAVDLAPAELAGARVQAAAATLETTGGLDDLRVTGRLTTTSVSAAQGRIALGDVELAWQRDPANQTITLGSAAFARAFLALRGDQLDIALDGVDLAAWQAADGSHPLEGQIDGKLHGPRSARQFDVSLQGRLDRVGGGLLPPELAAVANLLPATAKLAGRIQPEAEGRWAYDGSAHLAPRELGAADFRGRIVLPPAEPLKAEPLKAELALDFDWSGAELRRLTRLAPDPAALADLTGFVRARGRLAGTLGAPAIDAAFQIERAAWGDAAQAIAATTRLRWRGGDLELDGLVARGQVAGPKRPLALTLRGDVVVAGDLATLRGTNLEIAHAELFAAKADLVARRDPASPILFALAGRVQVADVPVAGWRQELGDALPAALDGYTFQGRLGADLQLTPGEAPAWLRADGTWRLAGLGFASADGSRVLEGLSVDGDLGADLTPSGDVTFQAGGATSGFQILWQSLYGDFTTSSMTLGARGSGRLDGGWQVAATVLPLEGPRIELGLALADGRTEFELDLRSDDLEPFRARYLEPLFAGVGGLRLAGATHLQAKGSLTEGVWQVRGELQLDGGHIQTATFGADGVSLRLPFDLRGADGEIDGERRSGSLSHAALRVAGLHFPAASTTLWTAGDEAGFDQAMQVDLGGGQVRLLGLTATDLFAAPRIETGVEIEGVKLEELTRSFALPSFEGTLAGSLPRVVLAGNTLQVEGGGRVEIFGGSIELGDISGEDVISRYPRLRLAAHFRDIDLGQVTRRFSFGEMHGIVQGYALDVELVRGMPLSFHARVESVKRRGVRQTVDVKAVENLTVLGTGSRTNILDRGIQRFFQRYNYQQLGIEAILENDVLLLRGLARRGDRELFLRGGFPFPIDVVNAQPGTTVSFQNMVRRLQRLDLGAVSTTP